MKFSKSPFSSKNILLGIGLTVLGTLLTPLIKKNRGSISIRRSADPLKAGSRFRGAREKVAGITDKFKSQKPGANDPVTRQEFEQLEAEIRKEREQLQELITTLDTFKDQYKQE